MAGGGMLVASTSSTSSCWSKRPAGLPFSPLASTIKAHWWGHRLSLLLVSILFDRLKVHAVMAQYSHSN